MNGKTTGKASKKICNWVSGMGMLMLGIGLGVAACYFVIIPLSTPAEKNSLKIEVVRDVTSPDKQEDYDHISTEITSELDDETVELVKREVKEELSSGVIEAAEVKKARALAASKKDSPGTTEPPENKRDSNVGKTMVTTTNCNVRTGPGVDNPPITIAMAGNELVIKGRCQVDNSSDWYEIELDDGSRGYINSKFLKDVEKEYNTGTTKCSADTVSKTASLTVELCPDKAKMQEISPDVIGETNLSDPGLQPPEVPCNQEIIEVPNEKYDIRPGDYHGELYQFLGRSIHEAIAAFPSFTYFPYSGGGRLYDNHWQTIAFSHKDTIYQIELSQCDPGYSLLGVSCGMDKDAARSALLAHDYPFDYFDNCGGYYMHSADDTEEVEIMILDGRVLTMVVRDLTRFDDWCIQAGL